MTHKPFVETQEELDALSYLEWSDERLGQLTRWFANEIQESTGNGGASVKGMAVFALLLRDTMKPNAERLKITVNDITLRDELIGDAVLTMRIKKHK